MILEELRRRAAADPQSIILPEGEDPRTIEAAAICARDRIAKITIIGNEDKIRELATQIGSNLNGIDILDHLKSHHDHARMAELYHQIRRSKGTRLEEAEQAVRDPLYYANLLVREG